jgi:type IV pilus assembly PilN-like protein
MQDIDFLPADYVCVRTTRTSNNWLRVVIVTAVSLMVVGALAQAHSLKELTTRRTRLQEQTNELLSKLGSPEALRGELKVVECEGKLLDVLRMNVPPTRWLSAIVQALPSQISLREMRSNREEISEPTARGPAGRGSSKPPEEQVADSRERDLNRLAIGSERQSLVISLTGTADDDQSVSSFLNALQRTSLFDRVQLLFTDQHGQGDATQRSFAVRLHIRPSPGRLTNQRPQQNTRPAITNRPASERSVRVTATREAAFTLTTDH